MLEGRASTAADDDEMEEALAYLQACGDPEALLHLARAEEHRQQQQQNGGAKKQQQRPSAAASGGLVP